MMISHVSRGTPKAELHLKPAASASPAPVSQNTAKCFVEEVTPVGISARASLRPGDARVGRQGRGHVLWVSRYQGCHPHKGTATAFSSSPPSKDRWREPVFFFVMGSAETTLAALQLSGRWRMATEELGSSKKAV